MENSEVKSCSKCGVAQPLSNFFNNKANPSGKASWCKSCIKIHKSSPDQIVRMAEYFRNRYQDHKDEVSEYSRLRYLDNREEILEQREEYRSANREDINTKQNQRRREVPERSLLSTAKVRSKRSGIPFKIAISDFVIPKFCPVLGFPLQVADGVHQEYSPSIDRIIPELGYVPGNIAVISHRANTIKNSGTSLEHRKIADWIESTSSSVPEGQPAEKAHARSLRKAARKRASSKNIPFDLNGKEILIPETCPVFGIPLVRGVGKAGPNSPTLDRIVPELGYVLGNIAVISYRANTMKSDGTASEHRKIADWMDSILAL